MAVIRYLQNLSNARLMLWAYLIWYGIVATVYFDPTLTIWLNAAGIAMFVGFSLYLNMLAGATKPSAWQTIRCYLTPFCVSSFSALVKNKGFFLIFAPDWRLDVAAITAIGTLGVLVICLRKKSPARIDPALQPDTHLDRRDNNRT